MPILQQQISSRHFTELRIYDDEVGLPDPWMQTARICEVIANVNRGRSQRPLTVNDFLPRRKPQTVDEQRKILKNSIRKANARANNRRTGRQRNS